MARVRGPGSTMSPARSRTPKLSTFRASQATAVHRIAQDGVAAPFGHHFTVAAQRTASIAVMSMSFGDTRSAPRANPAEDALSAMVSHSLICQSVIRVSISSMDGTNAAVATSTSSSASRCSRHRSRSSARMKPTSTSTRG